MKASSGMPAEAGGWMTHISGFCTMAGAEVVGFGNLRNFPLYNDIAQRRAARRASVVVV